MRLQMQQYGTFSHSVFYCLTQIGCKDGRWTKLDQDFVQWLLLKLLYCKYLIMEQVTIMATEATRQQSLHYGCIVQDRDTSEVTHYVEKPSTFVSTLINCGVYICSTDIFQTFAAVFNKHQQEYYKLVKLSKSY